MSSTACWNWDAPTPSASPDPRSGQSPSCPSRRPCNNATQLRAIAEHGRMAWQVTSGYTKRARAETAMSRFKRVIGDGLRSHADERRRSEVEVARPCPQPHAGIGTPQLRPHRLTLDRARAHRVRPADPCNNATQGRRHGASDAGTRRANAVFSPNASPPISSNPTPGARRGSTASRMRSLSCSAAGPENGSQNACPYR